VIAPSVDLLAILTLTVVVGSTAAERRARAQGFIERIGSRAAHGLVDRGFQLANTLANAGHQKIADFLRAGSEAAQRGDKAEAEKQFEKASQLATREGLAGARAKIDALDAEFTILE
jgi:hypothetical protein